MNQEVLANLRKRYVDFNKTVEKTTTPDGLPAGLFAQSSYLRIDQPLVNAQGEYLLDPMELNTPRKTYEKRLNRNDLFFVIALSLGIYYEPTARPGAGFVVTSIQDLKARLAAYGSNLEEKITQDLNAIYNGSIRLQTGTTQTFDGFPTHLLNVSHQVDTETLDYDPSKSMYFLPENIALAGTKDQKFTLKFDSYSGAVYNPPATTSPDFTPDGVLGVSLFMQGFLVKNGAIYVDINGKENPYLYI